MECEEIYRKIKESVGECAKQEVNDMAWLFVGFMLALVIYEVYKNN